MDKRRFWFYSISRDTKSRSLYNTIKKCVIHGPYWSSKQKSSCMKERKCTKKYSEQFNEETILDEHSYPKYKRRNNGRIIQFRNNVINNRWVVSYNLLLCNIRRYNAYINVEIRNSIISVKYLYKCIIL